MPEILKKAIIFVCLFVIIFAESGDDAYIQLVSEPGVSVFLDDIFKGKTTEEIAGLIIENVPSGTHSIKCVKKNYEPQNTQIYVSSGEVLVYNVKPFKPKINIVQHGRSSAQLIQHCVQDLKIQSLPVEILIHMSALDLKSYKQEDLWEAKNIPIGEYEIEFTWRDQSLKYSTIINEDHPRHLFVDMIDLKVTDRSLTTNRHKENLAGISFPKKNQHTKMMSHIFSLFLLILAVLFMLIPIIYMRHICSRFDKTTPGLMGFILNLSYFTKRYRRIEYNAYIYRISPKILMYLSMFISLILIVLAFSM